MRLFIMIVAFLLNDNLWCQFKLSENELAFKKFCEQIPTIKFPLIIDCNSNLSPVPTIADSVIKKYGGSEYIPFVYGKITTNKKYTAIIYLVVADIYVPIIKIHDKYGNPIDKFTLLQNCYGDICYEANSWAEITTDLKITIKDTIKTCALDTLDNIKPGSEKIQSTLREFIIDNEGKFEELK